MKGKQLALAIAMLAVAPAAFSQQIHATVNGTHVEFAGADPMMMNGRVMVPMRGVFEHMGADVLWNSATRTVTANRGTTDVKLYIGSRYADVDGNRTELDAPAVIVANRTMVPLRFISESLGADVQWIENTRTVAITMAGLVANTNPGPMYTRTLNLDANTVIPLTLMTALSSKTAQSGDKFTAKLDTNGAESYVGLPEGTIVEGHVNVVKEKTAEAPGVLGLAFDRVRFPSGQTYAINGSLIDLDGKSVDTKNGRIVAKATAKDNTKYVGIGAGAGAIIGILTEGNVITNAVIGAALGYLYGQVDKSSYRDVSLKQGTEFGVKLNQDESFVAVRLPR